MDKYYTPEIEEFHIGFEYEIYSEGLSDESVEDFCGWYFYKFRIGNCFRDIDDIEKSIKQIRVKYLDKEDIESLGFIKDSGDYDFIKNKYQIEIYSNNILHITEDYGNHLLFHGKVKNKSEIVKLLKQLGIG